MAIPRTYALVRNIGLFLIISVAAVATAFTFSSDAVSLFGDDDELPTIAPIPIGDFTAPVEVIGRQGDDRTFVVEQVGRVVASDGTVVLDISDRTLADGERGLLGAAFHGADPLLYAHYSDAAGDTVVAEYAVNGSTDAIEASERIIVTIEQPFENHNGGELEFGPDGYLYLGLGDGGLANDPRRAALDLTSPLGKILRIDPTPSGGRQFTVPVDNPFVDTPGADPTIWAIGLRNPWKFSFDAANGDLWIADVGQDRWEEINYAPASADGLDAGRGANFGWSAFEGTERFNVDQGSPEQTEPTATYRRTDGNCSVSGGAVYRGTAIENLQGWYLYGDFCSGIIWGFDTATPVEDREIVELTQVETLAAIATGGDGELYAVSISGTVSRLIAN